MATEVMTEVAPALPAASMSETSSTALNEKFQAPKLGGGISREEFLSADFKPEFLNMVSRESILLAGGAAAILLQVAEAGVGAGVNEHSNFAYRVVDRLRTTMTFVYVMGYGTPEERKVITDLVTQVHNSVNGTLNEGRDKGKRYDANDPGLQLWVAATLYYTAIDMYERLFGEIKDPVVHEKIYKEYSVLATSLRVPADMWPENRKAFYEYWDRKVNEIEITQHAKEVAHDLMHLTHAPAYLRIFLPSVRVITAEFLPDKIREGFGLKRHPKAWKFHEFLLKIVYVPLPASIRSYGVKIYMKDMRKRLRSHAKVFEKA